MKNKLLGIIAGSLLLCSLTQANAGLFCLDNWYISASGSVVWHDDLDFNTPATATSGPISSHREFKVGGGAAASIGYIFCLCDGWRLRLEEEVVYHRNSLDKASETIVLAGTPFVIDGPVSGHTQDLALMTNLLLDVPLGCNLGAYLGAGIGVSWNELRLSRIGDEVFSPATAKDEYFAWQFMAGLYYEFYPCIALTAGYRLFMTEKVKSAVGRVKSDDFPMTHSIDIGLMFRL